MPRNIALSTLVGEYWRLLPHIHYIYMTFSGKIPILVKKIIPTFFQKTSNRNQWICVMSWEDICMMNDKIYSCEAVLVRDTTIFVQKMYCRISNYDWIPKGSKSDTHRWFITFLTAHIFHHTIMSARDAHYCVSKWNSPWHITYQQHDSDMKVGPW